MPNIHYSGIDLTPVSELRLTYETVNDPSQLDYLFSAVHVSGTFIVNGQSDIRALDDPPVSLAPNGALLRKADDVARLPTGVPGGAVAPTTDGPERQRGAVNDDVTLFASPYSGSVASPMFATDQQVVTGVNIVASPAPVTHRLLVERLSMPRSQLVVYEPSQAAPDNILIYSPGVGLQCDSKGGPTPTLIDLTFTQGDGITYFVNWACTTYIRALRRSSASESLLSNRWRMTHHVREGGFTDVEVEGVAIFDLGIAHRTGLNPDAIRPRLFLPIPKGYVRKDIFVTENEEGNTLTYRYLDEQMEINWPSAVLVDGVEINTEHRQFIVCNDDVLTGALQAVDSTLNRKWQLKALRDSKRDEADKADFRKLPSRVRGLGEPPA
jgi:hypothetical protein